MSEKSLALRFASIDYWQPSCLNEFSCKPADVSLSPRACALSAKLRSIQFVPFYDVWSTLHPLALGSVTGLRLRAISSLASLPFGWATQSPVLNCGCILVTCAGPQGLQRPYIQSCTKVMSDPRARTGPNQNRVSEGRAQ
jgi:hypothetical protein